LLADRLSDVSSVVSYSSALGGGDISTLLTVKVNFTGDAVASDSHVFDTRDFPELTLDLSSVDKSAPLYRQNIREQEEEGLHRMQLHE
jgi:hypothetical protein